MPKQASKAKRSRAVTKKELESQLRTLKEELKGKESRVEELLHRLAYLQAEVENLRKSNEREKREFSRYANAAFLKRLLPVVDELELALTSMKDRDDDFVNGVRMVYDNLMKALEAEGLEEIGAMEGMFDPYLHEAVGYVEGKEKEGRVMEVLQKGYRLQDRILRPSQVLVSRGGGEESG